MDAPSGSSAGLARGGIRHRAVRATSRSSRYNWACARRRTPSTACWPAPPRAGHAGRRCPTSASTARSSPRRARSPGDGQAAGPRQRSGRTILITDAMRAAGRSDGEYDRAGMPCATAWPASPTAACRQHARADVALRNDRVRRAVAGRGVADGDQRPGGGAQPGRAQDAGRRRDADIALLNPDLIASATLVAGRVVYRSERRTA